ncbi:MAG: ABC transporter ATP-binding protein [Actinomycetota bacterium]
MSSADPPSVLIRATGLRKRFGDFTAVDGVDFEIRAGEAFGFLGPNGAGKTSVMRMIGSTSAVSEGRLEVLGLDPAADGPRIRSQLGVVAQDDYLDVDLSVWDNMVIYGRYFGIDRRVLDERAAALLDFVQLGDRRDDQVDPLSGGMKRRLAIARALINEPKVILLDEPTTGLDPQARHLLWERLHALKAAGVSLVITTHYMDEAEQLCDRLVIMDRGVIVDCGAPNELIDRHCPREVVEARFADSDDQTAVAARLTSEGGWVESLADRLLIYTDHGDDTASALHAAPGAVPSSVLIRRAGLEDVFLKITGRTLEES